MYGIRYLRVFDYVSVSECAIGPAREREVSPKRPQMEKKNQRITLTRSLPRSARTYPREKKKSEGENRLGRGPKFVCLALFY